MPDDGKSVLEKYLKPEHKYILFADQNHRDPTTNSWFYGDQNLADLIKLGVHKIAVESDNETVQAIINGSLSKEKFLHAQKYREMLSQEYDGIRKAHSLGFQVKGVDVELGIQQFLYDRYSHGFQFTGQDRSREIADYVDAKHANESAETKAEIRKAYMSDLNVNEKLNGFMDIYNRLYFDPKVAEQIRQFAGDDRVAVMFGAFHFMGSHSNVARNLGLGNSLIISTESDHPSLFGGPALSSLLPHRTCDSPNHCRLEAPSGGAYDPQKVDRYVMGRLTTPPYKRMNYAGIDAPEDRERLATVEAIYESAQLPVRKPDQFGPN